MKSRRAVLAGSALLLLPVLAARADTSATTPTDSLGRASAELDSSQWEQAIVDATQRLIQDPKDVRALEIRAKAYAREKLWDRAERDFQTADTVSPAPAYRFQIAEIHFARKDYTGARPGFVQLEADPQLGDLATYKVFLCDLLAGHESIAARDLAATDAKPGQPSNIYGHATWCLFHNDRDNAEQLFSRAGHLFNATIAQLYLGSLVESRRFHPATASFRTRDGRAFQHANVALESDGLRANSATGWTTLPLEVLPDDLSPFPSDLRAEIDRRRSQPYAPAAPPIATTPTISFTTRTGRAYHLVRWRVDTGSLYVLSDNGWDAVPLDDLPDDLSSFPVTLQQSIRKMRTVSLPDESTTRLVSFQTTDGKTYAQLRASLTDQGLRVLTPDGWIVVPASAIPAHAAGVPADWQASLAALRARAPRGPGPAEVSFTTAEGKSYKSVRATLAAEGIHLLTPDGWQLVPYDKMPADLSPFPPDWQDYIREKRSAAISVLPAKSSHS